MFGAFTFGEGYFGGFPQVREAPPTNLPAATALRASSRRTVSLSAQARAIFKRGRSTREVTMRASFGED